MGTPDLPEIILKDLMTRQVVTVSMDDSLKLVRELFDANHFHHLLVVDGHRLVGVISDRDLLRHLSPFVGHEFTERPQDVATLQKRVHQIMTRKLVTATSQTTVTQAARLMLEHRISCIPVIDEQGRPLGIVSWKDLLGALVGWADASATPPPVKAKNIAA